jgi:hypothetical protein
MAKKQRKANSSKKKPAAKKSTQINYGCKDHFCSVDQRNAHVGGPGSQVTLKATNTNVTISFDGGKSPFDPNVTGISLLQGTSKTFTVANSASGDYPYGLACSTCPTPSNSPDMIVP